MSTPLENAKKRLVALRREVEEIERFVAMYDAFSDEPDIKTTRPRVRHEGNSEEFIHRQSGTVDSGENSSSEERLGPTPTHLAKIMEDLIRSVGRPMTRGELVRALEVRDIMIPAQDKARYLGTIVWRNKARFINIKGRGYWLPGERPDQSMGGTSMLSAPPPQDEKSPDA
jgi:hypothetical protein